MAEITPLPNSAQVHVTGLGLNKLIAIHADPRDAKNGNASHEYRLIRDVGHGFKHCGSLSFQHGPRNVKGSTAGLTNESVLAVVLDRLRGFQAGPFKCRENALAITKLEEALHWLQVREMTRNRQGVLGKNEAHNSPE